MNRKNFRPILFVAIFLATVMSCNPSSDTGNSQLKESIITANDELFNKGNLAHADNLFAADYAGEGPDQIKKFVGELREAFPDLTVKVEPIIAEGNTVVFHRTHTGTHEGTFRGIPPSGKSITWESNIFSFFNDEGLIDKEIGIGNFTLRVSSESTENIETINKVGQTLIESLNSENVKGIIAGLSEDHVTMAPDIPELAKADGLAEWHTANFESFSADYQINIVEFIQMGPQWAMQRWSSSGTLSSKTGGADVNIKGKGIWLWQLEENGQWKLARSIWNSDGH